MPNLRRVLALGAASSFAALALAAPTAMAIPDPATCPDGLFQLVKLRSSQDNLTHTVTIAEQDDADAQRSLHKAEQDDADAKAVEASTLAKAQSTKTAYEKLKADPRTDPKALADAKTAAETAQQTYLDAQSDQAKTAAALVKARENARTKRSYLAEVKVDLNRQHGEVVRISVLVDNLCGTHNAPAPTTAPAPVPAPDAPSVIIQNNQIGQVPAGVPSGGGSMADIVE